VGIGTTTVSGTMLTVGTTTPALVVNDTGNVGIGTAAPGNALSVKVTGSGSSIVSGTANSAIRIKDTNTGVNSRYGISWEQGDSNNTIAAIEPSVNSGCLRS